MNRSAWSAPQRFGHGLIIAWLCVLLAVAGGCSGGGGDDSGSPPGPQTAADDDFLLTMTAALSQGQLTLNNHWTWQELNLGAQPLYEGVNQPPGRVRPYTTLVQEYRVRRKQCEEDFDKIYPEFEYESPVSGAIYLITDRKCYPTLTDLPYSFRRKDGLPRSPLDNPILKRYGYYSGGGFPPYPASNTSRFREGTPEPLDGVDYCSRLHDEQVWGPRSPTSHPSECGILACLYKASGLPANLMVDLLPDVETARQHWYDGAATACGGGGIFGHPNDAPPPALGP